MQVPSLASCWVDSLAVQMCTVAVCTACATRCCTEIVKFFSVIVFTSFLFIGNTWQLYGYWSSFVIRVGTQFAFSNKAVFLCRVSTVLVKKLVGQSVHLVYVAT